MEFQISTQLPNNSVIPQLSTLNISIGKRAILQFSSSVVQNIIFTVNHYAKLTHTSKDLFHNHAFQITLTLKVKIVSARLLVQDTEKMVLSAVMIMESLEIQPSIRTLIQLIHIQLLCFEKEKEMIFYIYLFSAFFFIQR
jgi:hypothetical protein